MSFLIIEDAVACYKYPPFQRWGHHPSSYSTQRENFVLSYSYPSISNPAHTAINFFFQNPSTSYHLLSATILVQGAIIPQLNYCSSLLADCPASFIAGLLSRPSIAGSVILLKCQVLSSSCHEPPKASSLTQ